MKSNCPMGAASWFARMLAACLITSFAFNAHAQLLLTPGAPGKNVNIVGPTPNPADIPDILLRQQNEPSCSVRPENPAYIFCAFNDYRATDFPTIQGDSWIGVSWSADFGKTWFSRLAPGFLSHPNSLGQEFAADPNVVHAPGDSSGIAVLNYIAATRDLNDGVLAIQRWATLPQEDINYYGAEDQIIIVDETNNGRFADKPTLRSFIDPPDQQTTLSITMDLEDGTTVTRNVPSGTLVLAYAVFTGSNSSKIYVSTSRDWGSSWTNPVKISEEQVRVQGVSLTNIGDRLVASWRRADSKGDKIVTAFSTTGGRRWTKGRAATDLCPLDQAATGVQIRMIDFPWMANDGELFYIFAADRRFGGDCATGISKIGMTYSADGRSWSPFEPLENLLEPGPFGEPSGAGYQYIPTATGYRGNVQVAWYDTRRETYPAGLPGTEPPFMRDYVAGNGTIVNRKADIYTLKLRRDSSGVPVASPAIRVSQYKTGIFVDPVSGDPGLLEAEAHFPNTPIFERGTRAFNGDYTSAAVADYRLEDGKWIQNTLSTGNDLTDREDVFVTWGDTRDLRGVYFAPTPGEPSPFTPNNEATAMAVALQEQADTDAAGQLLAESSNDEPLENPLTAETLGDEAADFGQCVPGNPQDRTRDANVYGSLIRDVSSFVALTPTKPLTGFQRTYPVLVSNPDPDDMRSFRLVIENQPSDFGSSAGFQGQASWNQLPSKPPFSDPASPAKEEILVDVDPKSSSARTMFLVTNDVTASILVNLYDAGCTPGAADCPVLANIAVGAGSELLESEFCENTDDTRPTACAPVNNLETHDPILQNPDLQSPDLQSVRLLSPDLQTPDLQTPDLQSPDLQTLGFLAPDLQSPDLQSPDLQTPDLQSPDLQSPDLQSPDLQTPDLQSAAYQDITYTVQNVGNVTTTYSADMSFNALDSDELSAQLIAWTTYVTPTSRECEYVPQGESQILASRNLTDDELQGLTLPTVGSPFDGPISFAARPGQIVHLTLRVFAPIDQLSTLSDAQFIAGTGFGASAHACNDANNIDPALDCLTFDQEKIAIDRSPPTFSIEDGFELTAIADRPGGACVDLVGSGTVSAEDSGQAIQPVCVANDTGAAVCTDVGDDALPIPLTVPGMPTGVTCSATDAAGNTNSVSLFVDVRDTGAPVFAEPLDEPGFTVTQPANVPASLPLEANVDFGPFMASDIVDESVDIECIPASGSPFLIGSTEVECRARDDGFNLLGEVNEVLATFNVVVQDMTPPSATPPVIGTVEANAEGGANYAYAAPDFSDNFDLPGDIDVMCTPESPAFFALGMTTVNCDATDTSGNMSSVSFDVTIADTQAPVFSGVPTSPVSIPADSAGTGSLNFEAQFSVADADGVDPDPVVDCAASAGAGAGAMSGDPMPIGETTISCTATDASGNAADAAYQVRVEYGQPFGINVSKGRVKSGSSVPLSFGWTGAGSARIDSGNADPTVSARDCATGEVFLSPGEFPGNSNLRYDASQKEWKFNWQTVLRDGSPIPATSSGTNYCLQVISGLTGQAIPATGYTVVKVRR